MKARTEECDGFELDQERMPLQVKVGESMLENELLRKKTARLAKSTRFHRGARKEERRHFAPLWPGLPGYGVHRVCEAWEVPRSAFYPWLLAPPLRWGPRREASRITRRSLVYETRTPRDRSRAHALRWPSPAEPRWDSARRRIERVRRSRAATDSAGLGPRGEGQGAAVE